MGEFTWLDFCVKLRLRFVVWAKYAVCQGVASLQSSD